MKTLKLLMIGSVTLGLSACAESALRFNSEAGAFLDEGGFGNPTMINMMAQMCSSHGKGLKGSVVGDPVVSLNPDTSPSAPRYIRRTAVSCNDRLNGKYAEVIFEEYVNSAIPTPVGNELTDVASE